MKAFDLIKSYLKQYRRAIAGGLLALMVVDLLQLMIPRVIKQAVDDLTIFSTDLGGLLRYGGSIALMAILIGIFRYVWRRCLLGTARRLEESLRNRLFGHIQTLSAGYFDHVKTGDLMAHATNDINQVRMAAGMGLVAFNDAVVLGAAAIGFMLYIHVPLTLYVLIPMPLIVLGTRILSGRMHHRYQRVQASFADLTETVREYCAGMRMIKAHNEEAASTKAVRRASQANIDQNLKLVGVVGLFFPLMILLTNMSLAIVLYFGGIRTILAEITPGEFVAFISYLNLLAWPMMALGWVTNLIQRGGASLERLKKIMERHPDIQDPAQARLMPQMQGRIKFSKVVFGYDPDATRWTLDNITLEVQPGQIIGIVGPPGSGKSTLLNLVPRLYDVNKGCLTIDGQDVRSLALADLRRQIAYVAQEPFLFAGTIRENLLFGSPRQCRTRLNQTIAQAGLQETVAGFTAGLDTVVGEKGILLSGGQKQRIALARALLIDAPVLLLDDPISQVDTATGSHIIHTIQELAGRKTIIIVSHRLAAVRFADWIISMQDGCLIEAGTHDQLLAGQGYYARVHALQELEDAD